MVISTCANAEDVEAEQHRFLPAEVAVLSVQSKGSGGDDNDPFTSAVL